MNKKIIVCLIILAIVIIGITLLIIIDNKNYQFIEYKEFFPCFIINFSIAG